MLSKSQISFITSLQQKKFRKQHESFIVEGIKSISEFINSNYQIDTIFSTSQAAAKLGKIPHNIKFEEVSEQEISKISALNTPQGAVAVVKIPAANELNIASLAGKHSILLDDIQDPGNLGTIIRTAEWFGFQQIICSIGTVDAYNPKVVQATMGSLSRISLYYIPLGDLIANCGLPTYGALLDGTSIYEQEFGSEGLIIMGNEGNGISAENLPLVKHAVTIPAWGKAESLNVAVATTVFCSELARRRQS